MCPPRMRFNGLERRWRRGSSNHRSVLLPRWNATDNSVMEWIFENTHRLRINFPYRWFRFILRTWATAALIWAKGEHTGAKPEHTWAEPEQVFSHLAHHEAEPIFASCVLRVRVHTPGGEKRSFLLTLLRLFRSLPLPACRHFSNFIEDLSQNNNL